MVLLEAGLVRDGKAGGRRDWELREHEIIVVKLLRAYGGCLGASRR